jgi:hypothetical protein
MENEGIKAEDLRPKSRFRCWRHLVLIAALCFTASSLPAQVVRLPAVLPPDAAYPGQLLSHPDSLAETLQAPAANAPPAELSPPEKSDAASEARPGMLQKAMFEGTYLARTAGSDGLGINDLELKLVLGLPCPTRDWPLLVTPGFAVHYLDGPADAEMPPRLYDAYCQFRWLHRFSPQWATDAAITPGVYSDFDQSSSEGFRLTGHAAAAWTWTPTATLVFGVGYFNRLDTKVLPIGGVIWAPNDDASYEILFPKPRLARRIYWCRHAEAKVQDWIYLAGEFGGGTWAIASNQGEADLVDLKDYRLIIGAERKVPRSLSARVEIGYVFGRQVQYQSNAPELEPPDTVMLRGALSY